jgi:mannosyl-3-phosphoglycerate phosphatase
VTPWTVTTPDGASPAAAPPLLVVTDLDATLLDEQSYSWKPASEAIDALAARGIPLVLCSSKTRAEMQPLAAELGLTAPLIVENGAAIIGHRGDGLDWPPSAVRPGMDPQLVLGASRDVLTPALAELAAASEVDLEPLSSMSVERISSLTGLPPESAELARRREFSEPFVTASPESAVERLGEQARARGLNLTRGGRFWHLIGPSDKGRAVTALSALYPRPPRGSVAVVALGDAPNDLEMLSAATLAVIIPRATGPHPALVRALPDAHLAPATGPEGWNAALLQVLRERKTDAADTARTE